MALELDDTVLDHRGNQYALSGKEPEWAISRGSVVFGHLVIRSFAGEEGEPVYTTRAADGTLGAEGTDWEQLVKGFLNEADPETPGAFGGTTAAAQ